MTSFAKTIIPSVGVALFGLGALGWLMLTQPGGGLGRSGLPAPDMQIGVVIPPWKTGGLRTAAEFGLPVIALRWAGHLVVLDISTRPSARGDLRRAGNIVITTSQPASCMIKETARV